MNEYPIPTPHRLIANDFATHAKTTQGGDRSGFSLFTETASRAASQNWEAVDDVPALTIARADDEDETDVRAARIDEINATQMKLVEEALFDPISSDETTSPSRGTVDLDAMIAQELTPGSIAVDSGTSSPGNPASETGAVTTRPTVDEGSVRSIQDLAGGSAPSRFLPPSEATRAGVSSRRMKWKPGDPFGAPARGPGERFRWEVMLSTACGTAASGLAGVWLLRTLLS